jgi:hypothetical protein
MFLILQHDHAADCSKRSLDEPASSRILEKGRLIDRTSQKL